RLKRSIGLVGALLARQACRSFRRCRAAYPLKFYRASVRPSHAPLRRARANAWDRLDRWLQPWRDYGDTFPERSTIRKYLCGGFDNLIGKNNAVSTFFRAIERCIRRPQQPIGILLATDDGDADADGNGNFAAFYFERPGCDCRPQPLGRCFCRRPIRTREEHRELLTTDPECLVDFAQARMDGDGHGAQYLVTRRMPVFVIDAFEMIEIEHQQPDLLVEAQAACKRLGKPLVEGTSVEQ